MKHLYRLILTFLAVSFIQAGFGQHFVPIYFPSNPYNPMSFIVGAGEIDGVDIETGDEIAVFDVNSGGTQICVGALVLTSGTGPFTFSAGADDPLTPGVQDGFINGHSIIYRYWDNSESKEITLMAPTYFGPPFDETFLQQGTAYVTLLQGYSANTWTGNVNNSWTTAGNWNTGLTTTASVDVIIPNGLTNYPTLTANGSCNNIFFEADATGFSSILGNNYLTVNGIATVQTFISSDQWHIVSSPISGQPAGTYYLGGTPDVYLMDFDEPSNSYNYVTDLSVILEDMQGYMLWVNTDDQIYNYSGSLNSGNFGADNNLTRTNQGWNMVGNPYPSSIDWDASSGWTKTNLDNAIYLFNNGTWASYVAGVGANGGSRYIAPGQGFFTRVSTGNTIGTLKMTDATRVHQNPSFFAPVDVITLIRLVAEGNNYSDETVIVQRENSTISFDNDFDAVKKMTTTDGVPQLYTVNDENYSINSIPVLTEMDLAFYCSEDGEFSISASEMNEVGNAWLEDKMTGIVTDLNSSNYSFSYSTQDDANRFTIHFNPVGFSENKLNTSTIYSTRNVITVLTEDSLPGQISVYNLLGQVVSEKETTGNMTRIEVNQTGYYLVKLTVNNNVITKKLFINE